MNTVIRHFSALINRLISEISEIGKRLTDIAVNISKLTLNESDRPIGENCSPNQKSAQKYEEPDKRVVVAEVHFKSEEVNRYYADGNKPNWVEIMALGYRRPALLTIFFIQI